MLVVPFPEAEPLIGNLRRAHTPSGRDGMPAHATVIAPFPEVFDPDVIRRALAPFGAFAVTLGSFGVFEHIGCLYLEPEPPEPFVAMSEAVLEVYPEIEFPTDGATEIVPHVTVGGHLTDEQRERIMRELEPQLPVRALAERAVVFARRADGRWAERVTFTLAA